MWASIRESIDNMHVIANGMFADSCVYTKIPITSQNRAELRDGARLILRAISDSQTKTTSLSNEIRTISEERWKLLYAGIIVPFTHRHVWIFFAPTRYWQYRLKEIHRILTANRRIVEKFLARLQH